MLSPTTSPESFSAFAKLVLPPSVPRSTARNDGEVALAAAAALVVKTKSAASAKMVARAWAKLLSIGKPLCSRRPHASIDYPSDDRSDPDPGHPPKEGARRLSGPNLDFARHRQFGTVELGRLPCIGGRQRLGEDLTS